MGRLPVWDITGVRFPSRPPKGLFMSELSKEGKEEFALAIIIWKDFKTNGKIDVEVTKTAIKMAQFVGVEKEYNEMLPKIPPLEIKERF